MLLVYPSPVCLIFLACGEEKTGKGSGGRVGGLKFLENWVDINIIIFENMNYVLYPFSLQFYYIMVPAQTCPLL